jgi:hypothetical protein
MAAIKLEGVGSRIPISPRISLVMRSEKGKDIWITVIDEQGKEKRIPTGKRTPDTYKFFLFNPRNDNVYTSKSYEDFLDFCTEAFKTAYAYARMEKKNEISNKRGGG